MAGQIQKPTRRPSYGVIAPYWESFSEKSSDVSEDKREEAAAGKRSHSTEQNQSSLDRVDTQRRSTNLTTRITQGKGHTTENQAKRLTRLFHEGLDQLLHMVDTIRKMITAMQQNAALAYHYPEWFKARYARKGPDSSVQISEKLKVPEEGVGIAPKESRSEQEYPDHFLNHGLTSQEWTLEVAVPK